MNYNIEMDVIENKASKKQGNFSTVINCLLMYCIFKCMYVYDCQDYLLELAELFWFRAFLRYGNCFRVYHTVARWPQRSSGEFPIGRCKLWTRAGANKLFLNTSLDTGDFFKIYLTPVPPTHSATASIGRKIL